MYVWEMNPTLRQKFRDGDVVALNEAWSGYNYLKQEFGHMFPRPVASSSGGVTRIRVGKAEVAFSDQCLTKVR